MAKEETGQATTINNFTIPKKVWEMSLAQLVAYCYYMEVIIDNSEDIDGMSDEDHDKLKIALSMILDEHIDVVTAFSDEAKVNILVEVSKASQEVIMSLLEVRPTVASSFEIPTGDYHEIQQLKKDAKGLTKINKKFKLHLASKLVKFFISDKPEEEPAEIWRKLLDQNLKKYNAEMVWKNWAMIPEVLSAIAWEEGQDRFTNDPVTDNKVVNWELIEQRKNRFMSMPADKALQAFTFFLITPAASSRIVISPPSSPKRKMSVSHRRKPGKNSTKNMGGTDTSKT